MLTIALAAIVTPRAPAIRAPPLAIERPSAPLMAAAGAVVQRAPAQRHEPPAVGVLVEPQEQHAEIAVLALLAVERERAAHLGRVAAAGAGDELAQADLVALPARALRREALVVVVVARDHDHGAGVLDRAP